VNSKKPNVMKEFGGCTKWLKQENMYYGST